jgi:hypothetical protein
MYFIALWYNLWPFGIFFTFWKVAPRKIWQPWFDTAYPGLKLVLRKELSALAFHWNKEEQGCQRV